jgi:hypothetical protein
VKEPSFGPTQDNLLSQNRKVLVAWLHTAAHRSRVGPQRPPVAMAVPSEAKKAFLLHQAADPQRGNEERKSETLLGVND